MNIMNVIFQENSVDLCVFTTILASPDIKQFVLTSFQLYFIHFYNILNKRSFEDGLQIDE